jgi:uncharacterized protein YjiS (DUF1127 family)
MGKVYLEAIVGRGAKHENNSRTWAVDWLAALGVWAARSRQRMALADLVDDDHLLKDIGVSRQDALREAAKPFWKR